MGGRSAVYNRGSTTGLCLMRTELAAWGQVRPHSTDTVRQNRLQHRTANITLPRGQQVFPHFSRLFSCLNKELELGIRRHHVVFISILFYLMIFLSNLLWTQPSATY